MAGQDLPVGRHDEVDLAPAAVAGLRILLVIVREDEQDLHSAPMGLLGPLGDLERTIHLLACRHERVAIDQSPAVVLRVGQLEPVGAHLRGQVDDLLNAVEVRLVEHDVDREGEPEFAHQGRGRALLLHRSHAGDPLGIVVIGVLQRDLDVLQPGLAELLGAGSREPESRGDQRAVQSQAPGVRGQFLGVLAHQRLAAGEAELQHAKRPRLGDDALPVLGGDLSPPGSGRADWSSKDSAAGSDASAPPAAWWDVHWSRISSRSASVDR